MCVIVLRTLTTAINHPHCSLRTDDMEVSASDASLFQLFSEVHRTATKHKIALNLPEVVAVGMQNHGKSSALYCFFSASGLDA